MDSVYLGQSRVRTPGPGGSGDLVERDGEPFYRISGYDRMPPFFMSVVSGYDHWMFVSSTGGLTCGRRDPDHALFPYDTDDKIHDAYATTGPQTILLVERDGRKQLWKPFAREVDVYDVERNLYRSRLGNRLIFEERNHDLGLCFRYGWAPSERYGFARRAELCNEGDADVRVELLDGLRNLLPSGVDRSVQTGRSTLVDAYKQAEAVPGRQAAVYSLSSLITDRAEPGEALEATVACCVGLDASCLLLSEDQVGPFCRGVQPIPEPFVRGMRGAFYAHACLELTAGGGRDWYLLADTGLGPCEVTELLGQIDEGLSSAAIGADVDSGTARLLDLVGSADGCQCSSDPLVDGRHLNNTLFNIMRGGTFEAGYEVPPEDLLAFVESWNRPLRARFETLLRALDAPIRLDALRAAAEAAGDGDMERLVLEYLPLTFSRRHGDPSRPWNHFSIEIRNPDGSDRLDFQGNWRDIFQNWEALSISYPEYLESFIAKFVNASTVDGYNPYRISRSGFDWETLDPTDAWSNIGYWGDHQVVYLLRLLERSVRFHPGRIQVLLDQEIFAYADVPYRLRPYADQLHDPRATVDYDESAAARIAGRVARIGSDGKLAVRKDGSACRANLLEKLLVPILAKLVSFAPGGGIWMNTQRPEWNDANNALVGYGLSMVTLYHLRRLTVFLSKALADSPVASFTLSREVADLLRSVGDALSVRAGMLQGAVNDRSRKEFMEALGALGDAYRQAAYAGFSGERSSVGADEVGGILALAIRYLDHTIDLNRRGDGLFHSYNLVHFDREGYSVETLQLMLEGQVAVLGSGCLDPRESLELLEALQASELYRDDQCSYMLYPDRSLPRFTEKNLVEVEEADCAAWIRRQLESGGSRYLQRDRQGRVHFSPRFCNAAVLRAELECDESVSGPDAEALCALYESVFSHRRFTGRSGAMYKYEGLGCIYWHMVSKLALAVAELIGAAVRSGEDGSIVDALFERFEAIRQGLGLHKTPARYGAFPVDPYSHTPGFAGVQQPGMTGQVKEDVITRFMELGVRVADGEVSFEPLLLRGDEFLREAARWTYSAGGGVRREALPAGSLGFTLCGVPVVYRRAEAFAIRVFSEEGPAAELRGAGLGRDRSRSLFTRDGRVRRIEVDLPAEQLR